MISGNEVNGVGGHSEQVRERLLDASEEVMAAEGFDGASVRQITSLAGCNIASVNYHFGGKENLYVEMFRRRLREMTAKRKEVIEEIMSAENGPVSLERLLEGFSRSFIEPVVDEEKGRRFIKLMIREMNTPRLPRRMFNEEVAEPTLRLLGSAMKEIYPGIDDERLMLCMISVIGQLVHLIRLTETIGAEMMGEQFHIPELSSWIDHVVKFSAAGVRSYFGDGE
jgi:AcrR family transcriptional regulator